MVVGGEKGAREVDSEVEASCREMVGGEQVEEG